MDNQQPDESISNPVPHVHHYVLKGSGLSCWAEGDAVVRVQHEDDSRGSTFSDLARCVQKLAGDNGPIVGSRAKVEKALAHD